MAAIEGEAELGTHRVENQPPGRGDLDLVGGDRPLQDGLAGLDAGRSAELAAYGLALGREEMRWAARDANRNPPELQGYDRGGRRLDELRFHPAYHLFMELSISAGYHALPWEGQGGGHLAHAAMVYLASQVEPGHCCPLTMTYAGIAAISDQHGAVAQRWCKALMSRHYDPSVRELSQKSGATLGMALTEKQGGSDVRSNATIAEPDGDVWRLTGHKWFCSAPMSDGFLTLAQGPEGLSCFLVPRWLEGGRNGIRIARLKDKLGNRSNGSSEIEYERALAWPLGAPGAGVRTIIEMIHHTRLDTAMAPAGLMRAALAEAHHWVSHRSAFQRRLIDQPLMRTVLADLALDLEGSLALGLRVAGAFDGTGEADRAFARIGVALAKYLSNKLCPVVVCEAMEILGGAGYVEDGPLPMLYREAPLNGIWEGSGNVICLDVLRTLTRDPAAREVLMAEFSDASAASGRFASALSAHQTRWPGLPEEAEARAFVERTALLLAAAALLRTVPAEIAEAFIDTRLLSPRGRTPGAIPAMDAGALIDRLGPGG